MSKQVLWVVPDNQRTGKHALFCQLQFLRAKVVRDALAPCQGLMSSEKARCSVIWFLIDYRDGNVPFSPEQTP